MDRIIVTGAAGVLGRTVLALLRERGWQAVGVDLVADSSNPLMIGGVQLTDADATRAAFDQIARQGAVGGLVNIAGGFAWETIGEGTPATWERMFQINVLTALNASRAVLPHLTKPGAIVNVGAAAAIRAGTGMGAYAAAKSGVVRLTEALAEELKAQDVRVNAILPSIIDTPANRADMGDAEAGKWVQPQHLAEVVAFLLSDAASAITGASIPVTGRI